MEPMPTPACLQHTSETRNLTSQAGVWWRRAHLAPDIMDRGYDISAEKICLVCAEGIGWGQGCVYPMCGEDEFGSIKLDKHLPVKPFQQRKVTRIVVYPLLVHYKRSKTRQE